MRDHLRRLAELQRWEGSRGIWRRSRSRLYSRGRFVRCEIDLASWQAIEPAAGSVEIRAGSLDELHQLRRMSPERLSVEFYADRLHGARRFYLGLCEGRLAHISWLLTSEDPTLLIRLAPGEIELNYVHTVAAYRGRGLLAAVQTVMLEEARRQGMRRAYTHVAVGNTASLRAVARAGFRPAGMVTLTWLLGASFTRYRPSPS